MQQGFPSYDMQLNWLAYCFVKMQREIEVPFGMDIFITVFSNMLKDTQLHNLADSDEHEVVQQVQVSLNSI